MRKTKEGHLHLPFSSIFSAKSSREYHEQHHSQWPVFNQLMASGMKIFSSQKRSLSKKLSHKLDSLASTALNQWYTQLSLQHPHVPPENHTEYTVFFLITFIYFAAPGLSGSMWDPVPWPGMEPERSAPGEWSLSHSTREIPGNSQHLMAYSTHSYLTFLTLQRVAQFLGARRI